MGRVSTDWIIAFSAREAKVPLQEFSEVRCCWKVPPRNAESYAATHPHKDKNDEGSREGQRGSLVTGGFKFQVEPGLRESVSKERRG